MAQNMSICNFCELSSEIKWKCIDCDLILCEKCKTMKHSKFKGSEWHTIIALDRLGTKDAIRTMQKLDLQQIVCSCHCKEKCYLYCQDCSLPICLSCILEEHKGHRASKIGVVFDNQYSELEKARDSIEFDITLSNEMSRYLHERKQGDLNNYNTIKNKILEREKEMKESVTAQAANIIKELDEMHLSDDKLIAKEEENIQNYKSDLNLKKAVIDKALDSCQSISVLNTVCTLDFKMPKTNFKELPKQQTAILTEVEPEMNINLRVLKVESMVELTEVNDTGESIISNLKTLEKGVYVMVNSDHNTIKQFVFQDGRCEFVKSIELAIFDLTVTIEGSILASDDDSEVIYNITDSRKEIFKSIALPRKARGVHVCRNQNLFVGFVDFSSHGVGIAIIDMKSDRTQEFAIPADSIPEKITSDMNGDICVIQSEYTPCTLWEGMIVSYEINPSLGKIRWKYEGNEQINTLKDFAPCDIAISRAGLVLSVDFSTSTIHVLSSNGCFLTFIGAREGVYSPRSLNVDNEGQLLIGSDETTDLSAKIFVAKFIT